jgi:hypothetical protein
MLSPQNPAIIPVVGVDHIVHVCVKSPFPALISVYDIIFCMPHITVILTLFPHDTYVPIPGVKVPVIICPL